VRVAGRAGDRDGSLDFAACSKERKKKGKNYLQWYAAFIVMVA